jgi:hypothetical protein
MQADPGATVVLSMCFVSGSAGTEVIEVIAMPNSPYG